MVAFTKTGGETIDNLYAHATTKDSLLNILNSGRLRSLKSLQSVNPETTLSVEPDRWSRNRESLKISEAIKRLKKAGKVTDKVFLTKGRYEPSYGDHIIVKKLTHPKPFSGINTIADEYVSGRPLSTQSNTTIYVPKNSLQELRKIYPKNKFEELANSPVRKGTLLDKPIGFFQKLRNSFFEKISETKKYNRRELLVGSKALGTALAKSSDTDIFIPYKTETGYLKAIDKLKRKHPELSLARQRKNKTTFTQNNTDVVLGWGEPASNYVDKFLELKKSITPEQAAKIVKHKEKLKNSWLFPETRYKKYKKDLAEKNGLAAVYF